MIRLPISKARFEPIENLYKVAFGLERIILHKHDKDLAAVVSIQDLLLLELIKKGSATEQTIVENLARLAAIVESSEDAIIGKTLEGVITNWNPGAEKLYGYSTEEILGKSIAILAPKERANEAIEILEKIRQGQQIKHFETTRICKDGREIFVSLTVSPIKDASNKIIGASTIARDITERKKAESELRQTKEKLRLFSRNLQSLQEEERANITHQIQSDIGQVLTALKMELAWLYKKLAVNQEPLQKKVEKMKTLIEQSLQTVDKISTELRPKALDDLGLTSAIEWEVAQFQKNTNIECNLNIPEEIILDSAYSIFVFRILQESLSSLARITSQIDINIYQSEDLSFLFLELASNNFDFSKQTNLSLDLFGVQERALLLGGKVEVRQENEKLIVLISIALPKKANKESFLSVDSENTKKSFPLAISNKQNKRAITKILIADSHAIVREGLKQILAEIPDIVVAGEVSNGQELMQKIRNYPWDVLVMDISLPGKNGLDLLKQIKAEFPLLPILILSTQTEEAYALRVLKVGAAGCLNKESAPEELIQAIQKIAEGGQYISESIAEQLIFELKTDTEKPLHKNLSDREFQILCLIASGKNLTEIAKELRLSIKTISTYRSKLLEKIGLKNNAEIVRYAITNELLT